MNDLLRRAAPGLALAGAALTTVWLFDPALTAGPDATPVAGSAQRSGATSGGTQDPSAAEGSDGGDAPEDDAGSSADTPKAAPDPSTTASGCTDTTSATGDEVLTRWGPVQVTMDLAADGSVCGVHAIAYPENDPHSARLNAQAISILDSRAAQDGVSFDAVSGATYTSEAYRASMQSILDAR